MTPSSKGNQKVADTKALVNGRLVTDGQKGTSVNSTVVNSIETPSSLVFSKQELAELADYLRYAQESIRDYANETHERRPGIAMVRTLRAYAERAQVFCARIESSLP